MPVAVRSLSPVPQIGVGVTVVLRHNMVDHELTCGDASVLPPPQWCETLFYDPPWGADPGLPHYRFRSKLVFTDGKNLGNAVAKFGPPTWQFVWDCVSSWYTRGRPLKRHKSCLWYGEIADYEFDGYFYGPPTESKTVRNTRGAYRYIGNVNGRRVTDLFVEPITALHARGTHKHSKPIDWLCALIACCGGGRPVYDPFAGSGAAMFACMALGVRSASVEVDPEQCVSIVSGALAQGAELVGVIERGS